MALPSSSTSPQASARSFRWKARWAWARPSPCSSRPCKARHSRRRRPKPACPCRHEGALLPGRAPFFWPPSGGRSGLLAPGMRGKGKTSRKSIGHTKLHRHAGRAAKAWPPLPAVRAASAAFPPAGPSSAHILAQPGRTFRTFRTRRAFPAPAEEGRKKKFAPLIPANASNKGRLHTAVFLCAACLFLRKIFHEGKRLSYGPFRLSKQPPPNGPPGRPGRRKPMDGHGRKAKRKKHSPAQGALPQESIAPKRQFLHTASSDFLDRHKGYLRKVSLLCIKNCRFRGAVRFWPGGFGGGMCKKVQQI